MGVFRQFPYSNFHEMNMDEIIKIIKNMLEEWAQYHAEWDAWMDEINDDWSNYQEIMNEAWQDMQDFINNYFDNLDVQVEINNKITSMVASGEFADIVEPYIPPQVTTWLNANITEPIGVVIDASLTVSGACADAEATGDEIRGVENKVITLQNNTTQTLELKKYMVSNAQSYMNADGSIASGLAHNLIRLKDNTIAQIMLPVSTSEAVAPTVVIKNNGTVVGSLDISDSETVGMDISTLEYTDIFINWWNSNNTAWYDEVGINYANTVYDNVEALKCEVSNLPYSAKLSDFELYQNNKYANGGGSVISYTNSSGHGVFRTPADDITYVKIEIENELGAPLTLAVVIDENDNVIKQISGRLVGNYEMEISPQRNTFLLVNGFSYKTYPNPYYGDIVIQRNIAEAYSINDSIKANYHTLVRRPFNFSGKVGTFAGDSITYGFTSGNTSVHGTGDFPTLFCAKVGMTNNNISVGGALFCSGYNEVKTIPEQIEDVVGNTFDYLFIAGGINDWQLGVDLDTFKTTIENLCTYINTNFPNNLPVIWITPINQAGYENTHPIAPIAQVDDYRKIITRTVFENDTYARFSVIQGTDFNFPAFGDDADYISAMFGDLLHPSALAYKTLYVSGLLTALC